VYIYGIKIQISIKQNLIEKYAGKLQIFFGLVRPCEQWSSSPLFTLQVGRNEEEEEGKEDEGSRAADQAEALTATLVAKWRWGRRCFFFSTFSLSSVSTLPLFFLLSLFCLCFSSLCQQCSPLSTAASWRCCCS
jgi:hypothetical protein